MPFSIGISGLNAANADLKVTGNNIANTGTIGFKSSRAEFSNIYALSKTGASSNAIGAGVRVSSVSQQFSQGNISFTENNLDLAINGDGFFTIRDNAGATVYSRNGQFKVDQDGFLVNNDGNNLQGFQVDDATDTINTGQVGNLQLTTTQIAPQASSTSGLLANLDSASETISNTVVIDPIDPSTYTHTTSYTTYDSLGNAMLTSLYFQKTDGGNVPPDENSWIVGVKTVDGSGAAMPVAGAGTGVVAGGSTDTYAITFDTTGKLATITDATGQTYDSTALPPGNTTLDIDYGLNRVDFDDPTIPPGPAASTNPKPTNAALQFIGIDIADLTQYGANFGVTDLKQNGFTTGNLAGVEIDQSGIMQARFTNGQSKKLGQIILSGFINPQGLGQQGNNNWAQTFASGQPVINVPGDGGLGSLTSGGLEQSNTDLTGDLINLIIAQRNFQANAKTITTADTITQTIINM